jgi:hypothetical protein
VTRRRRNCGASLDMFEVGRRPPALPRPSLLQVQAGPVAQKPSDRRQRDTCATSVSPLIGMRVRWRDQLRTIRDDLRARRGHSRVPRRARRGVDVRRSWSVNCALCAWHALEASDYGSEGQGFESLRARTAYPPKVRSPTCCFGVSKTARRAWLSLPGFRPSGCGLPGDHSPQSLPTPTSSKPSRPGATRAWGNPRPHRERDTPTRHTTGCPPDGGSLQDREPVWLTPGAAPGSDSRWRDSWLGRSPRERHRGAPRRCP